MNYEEFKNKYLEKTYIGDAVYVNFDGFNMILSTERDNGVHWIALEPEVFESLVKYKAKVYEDANKIDKA